MFKRGGLFLITSIILSLIVVGCSQSNNPVNSNNKKVGNTSISKDSRLAENGDKKTSIIKVYDSQPSSNNDNSMKLNTYPQNLLEFVILNKQDIINQLGKNYEIVPAGGEGAFEGYRYKQLGITIVFENDNAVSFIECNETVNINGVNPGMNFIEIQEKLGKASINETWVETPDNKAYEIKYTIDKNVLRFLSFNSDGADSILMILKNN